MGASPAGPLPNRRRSGCRRASPAGGWPASERTGGPSRGFPFGALRGSQRGGQSAGFRLVGTGLPERAPLPSDNRTTLTPNASPGASRDPHPRGRASANQSLGPRCSAIESLGPRRFANPSLGPRRSANPSLGSRRRPRAPHWGSVSSSCCLGRGVRFGNPAPPSSRKRSDPRAGYPGSVPNGKPRLGPPAPAEAGRRPERPRLSARASPKGEGPAPVRELLLRGHCRTAGEAVADGRVPRVGGLLRKVRVGRAAVSRSERCGEASAGVRAPVVAWSERGCRSGLRSQATTGRH